ncbi:MAG: MotA/TolQ/ExbB proton channel family protein [Planctomycetaceae bacterium]
MIDMLLNCGVLGIVLAVLALLALTLVIERVIAYRRESTDLGSFSRKFSEAIAARRFDDAAAICEQHRGHIAEVYRLAVEHRHQGGVSLRNILSNHVELTVLPRLRARLRFLSAIGKGAPMVGLLGTVQGMMGAFATIAGAQGQGVDPKQLAGNIGLALGTTFLGLLIAIPVTFASTYLRARVEQFTVDLDRYTDHCIDLLSPTGSLTRLQSAPPAASPVPVAHA